MSIIPKKSLGQNFLVDKNVLKKIVNIFQIKDQEILEVGPGTGNLTKYILDKFPKKIYVVEKDQDLIFFLQKKFKNKINIINEDILKISVEKLSKNKLIVFGNLPYNISTQILSKWIIESTDDIWFEKLILLFQKEVAERIIAKVNTSNYGRLSVLSNWKLNIEKITDIKSQSFYPRPKIDSTLLVFSPKKKFVKFKKPKNLEKITRIFFNQRRKMIKKPFNQIFHNHKEIVNKLDINLNLRPQNLNHETYYLLTKELEELTS